MKTSQKSKRKTPQTKTEALDFLRKQSPWIPRKQLERIVHSQFAFAWNMMLRFEFRKYKVPGLGVLQIDWNKLRKDNPKRTRYRWWFHETAFRRDKYDNLIPLEKHRKIARRHPACLF